jgi:hypothetical protein|tara:strand:- start:17 stop:307 length:291 start_codon:yes stop_codon:yes gene_type:complete
MDLLIFVSSKLAGPIFIPLAKACERNNLIWSVFFTGEGIHNLRDSVTLKVINSAESTVVCEESWTAVFESKTCPVKLGSQTDNSFLVSKARKVISL